MKKVIIMGAAGRDFHVFNTCFRDNPNYQVVAFTATQIPYIENKTYPLAGELYSNGIPIYPEEQLSRLIEKHNVNLVVFAYSDVSYQYLMHKGSIVMAAGANFMMFGPYDTMLESNTPIISICATRTGCGKSQTTRKILEILKKSGKRVVAIRHPMPYGDLVKQEVQRFANIEDLNTYNCTIEEREEYEPYISRGFVVYAGVDYGKILIQAEKEADIILWDGGNNDFPFYKPNLEIVVVDPLRPNDEINYYPGEINLRRADIVIINKMDSANDEDIKIVRNNIKRVNPATRIIYANSKLTIDNPQLIKDKIVLCIEDGPTTTHGNVKTGAACVAALRSGAKELISAKNYAIGEISTTYEKYPEVGNLLPAMGYSKDQINDLQETINATPCDVVILGTPINLKKILNINKPIVTVKYDLEEIPASLTLKEVIKEFLENYFKP